MTSNNCFLNPEEKWKLVFDELRTSHKKLFQTLCTIWASLVAQMVKRMPTMRETLVQSLGQEDPLEKKMAIHSSILAW